MLHTKYSSLLCLAAIMLGAGCMPRYGKYAAQYSFAQTAVLPQYGNLQYWAAHPWKKDPSDSTPLFLLGEKRDSSIDVFFVHPTTYTGERNGVNADVNDPELNAKTDYSTLLYQATAFNQQARVFAPRYRQMHLSQFFVSESESKEAFDTAYSDVRRAFQLYLSQYHKGRPLIIAGHSQGALLAQQLLKEFVDARPLQQKLVAAYLVGWPILSNTYNTLPVCATPVQTGCVCSWRTFRKGYVPAYVQQEKPVAWVTNPLSWDTTETYRPRQLNAGALLRNFNKRISAVADAQRQGGVLWISKPKFKGSFLFRTRNYHIADVNLFYVNIRQNVAQRVAAFSER